MSVPIAAVDCGTNTIKLLVGDPLGDPAGVRRESRMIRLGQGVDATGRLAPEALERAWVAIDEYAAIIRDAGVERIRFCATSATRDAENAAEFTAGVRQRLGVDPEVLSGEEEARLAFDGAIRGLGAEFTLNSPVLVVDIGGGSTELILGDPATGPTTAYSMNIGGVRLYERHVRHDPASPAELAAIIRDIDAALDASPVHPADATEIVGIAGTITTIVAGVEELKTYDRQRIHGAINERRDVERQIRDLVAMTIEQRRGLGYMHPGRADVIVAGALILQRVLDRARPAEDTVLLIAAETDILDGIAWSLL